MKVKVKRCEFKQGKRISDGTDYAGTNVLVLFPDGSTAAQLFVSEDVCDPVDIVSEGIYDLYRNERGMVLVFDKVEPVKQ